MNGSRSEEDPEFEIAFYEGLLRRRPDFLQVLIVLAELYTRRSRHEEALRLDERLAALRPDDPVIHYNLACSRALLGRVEEALDALRRAVRLGYDDFDHMDKDPDLASLRRDPRYRAWRRAVHRTASSGGETAS